MPRIRQYAEKYSNEDFLREVRSKQGYYNLRTQEELGKATGIWPQPSPLPCLWRPAES